jgi:hypothetical protein
MRRPRVSIAGLMVVVLISALGVAALKAATPLWASIVLTTTLALLGLAILGAMFRSGDRRAFWAGFAVFGWGYLTLAFGPWFATEIEPKLATSLAIARMHEKLHPGPSQTSAILGVNLNTWNSTVVQAGNVRMTQGVQNLQFTTTGAQAGGPGTPLSIVLTTMPTTAPNQAEFARIGHALFALLAAFVGGVAARWFAGEAHPATSEVAA